MQVNEAIRSLMIDDDLSFSELFLRGLNAKTDLQFDLTVYEDMTDNLICNYDMYFLDNQINGIPKCIDMTKTIKKSHAYAVIFVVSGHTDRSIMKELINTVKIEGFVDKHNDEHAVGILDKNNLDLDGVVECAQHINDIKHRRDILSNRLATFNERKQ